MNKLSPETILYIQDFISEKQFIFKFYTGYPCVIESVTKMFLLSQNNEWKDVVDCIKIFHESLNNKYIAAKEVLERLKQNQELGDIEGLTKDFLLCLDETKLPSCMMTEFLMLLFLKLIRKPRILRSILNNFIFLLQKLQIKSCSTTKEILKILYFLLYFHEPKIYDNMTEDEKKQKMERFYNFLKKLSIRFIVLIMASKDINLNKMNFKKTIFLFFLEYGDDITGATTLEGEIARFKWDIFFLWWDFHKKETVEEYYENYTKEAEEKKK